MQEKIPDLKQFRKELNRHVLVLEAQVSEQDKYKLIHLSNNVLRTAGNDLTGVMKKNYDQHKEIPAPAVPVWEGKKSRT